MDGDNRVVMSVRVVVHSMGAWPNQMSDNHWSIYLLLGNDAGSVHLNMTAEDEDDVKGTLKLRSLAYSLTNSQIRYWDFEAAGDVSVGSVVKLIKRTVVIDMSSLVGALVAAIGCKCEYSCHGRFC